MMSYNYENFDGDRLKLYEHLLELGFLNFRNIENLYKLRKFTPEEFIEIKKRYKGGVI